MDIREIQDLIKFVAKSGVSEVQLETDDFKLTVITTNQYKGGKETVVYQMPAETTYAAPAAAPVSSPAAPAAQTPASSPAQEDNSKLITLKAPMIGTFYRSAGPDKPPFINVGDEIAPGKVLCIIEAMKLFNEIESDVKGKIVKVLADDASPVEYDQPLFLVDPS